MLREEYSFDLPLSEYVKIIGTSDDVLFDYLDAALNDRFDRNLFLQSVNLYFERTKGNMLLREGFLDILKQVKDSGILLAIASSSSREWVEGFLQHHQLEKYFREVKTQEDVEEVKPDPELYIKTLEALGVTADETVAVEDSVNGSLAAIRAGINCLVIPNDVTRSLSFHEKVTLLNSYADFQIEQYLDRKYWNK